MIIQPDIGHIFIDIIPDMCFVVSSERMVLSPLIPALRLRLTFFALPLPSQSHVRLPEQHEPCLAIPTSFLSSLSLDEQRKGHITSFFVQMWNVFRTHQTQKRTKLLTCNMRDENSHGYFSANYLDSSPLVKHYCSKNDNTDDHLLYI